MSGVLSVLLGSGGGSFTIGLAPAPQVVGNASFTWTFTPVVATVTGGAGTITYLWSIEDEETGGSWSITAGQGTSTCTVEAGAPSEYTTHAVLRCTVTRGGVSDFADAYLEFSNTSY